MPNRVQPQMEQKKGLSPDVFAEEYQVACEKASKALREYLGDPSEDNTRMLRAAVRRQSTMIGMVPKRSRSRNMKVARERCKKVLKATSRVRDLDIVRARLSGLSGDETVLLLLNNMEEERSEYVTDSMRPAWKLFEVHDKKAHGDEFRGVARWVRRALEELDVEMTEEIAVVLKNEGRVEELHSLRKHTKRFRYALELLPQTPTTARAGRLMRSWQDILGEVRDNDTVIAYLGRARQSRSVREAAQQERALRHKRYLAFVRSCSREFKDENSPLRLAALKR